MISLSYKVLFFKLRNITIWGFIVAFSSMEQLSKLIEMFTPLWPIYQEDNSKTCKKLDFLLNVFLYLFWLITLNESSKKLPEIPNWFENISFTYLKIKSSLEMRGLKQ